MSNTHQDALPQHIPGHDARHGSADHSKVAPGEIAIGVIIGRASEYFDFFVFGIASVLVFPAVFGIAIPLANLAGASGDPAHGSRFLLGGAASGIAGGLLFAAVVAYANASSSAQLAAASAGAPSAMPRIDERSAD